VEIFWLEIFANHYSELESIALSSAALVTAEKVCSHNIESRLPHPCRALCDGVGF